MEAISLTSEVTVSSGLSFLAPSQHSAYTGHARKE